jgi:type IV secretion system protein VirB9
MKRVAYHPSSPVVAKQLFLRVVICMFLLITGDGREALAQPITSDSRIKTFVYNPNEVFGVTTHYGYQSNIEFGPKEVIDTISVGDRVAWQITPAGGRLFIRAMEENARTNMTVVTNFRAYQFDLRSSTADAVFGSAELTYVVRFFYPPQTMTDAASTALPNPTPMAFTPPVVTPPALPTPVTTSVVNTPTYTGPVATVAPVAPVIPAAPVIAPQTFSAPPPPIAAPAVRNAVNYRYTFSGPNDIAPTKIYDDGKTTYFKLPANQNPRVAIVTARGETIAVPQRRTADGLLAVDAIGPRFRLNHSSGREVIVYNEAGGEVY